MDILEDNRFFRQLGFTKDCAFLLNVDEQTFRDCFNDNVSDNVNFFGVSSHKKRFHGRMKSFSFDIYWPTKFINNTSIAMTKGTYENFDSKIKVRLMTYISITMVLLFYSMLFLIAIIANALMINSENNPTIVFIVFNAFYIFFGLRLFFHFRNAVSTLTSDVEREMGYWTAKANALQQSL